MIGAAFKFKEIEPKPALAAIEETSNSINMSTNCLVNKTERMTKPPTNIKRKPSRQIPRMNPKTKPNATKPKIPYKA